jgi:hypothetical protein
MNIFLRKWISPGKYLLLARNRGSFGWTSEKHPHNHVNLINRPENNDRPFLKVGLLGFPPINFISL